MNIIRRLSTDKSMQKYAKHMLNELKETGAFNVEVNLADEIGADVEGTVVKEEQSVDEAEMAAIRRRRRQVEEMMSTLNN